MKESEKLRERLPAVEAKLLEVSARADRRQHELDAWQEWHDDWTCPWCYNDDDDDSGGDSGEESDSRARGDPPPQKVHVKETSRLGAVTPPVGVRIDQLGAMRFRMRLLPRRRVDVVPARMRRGDRL